MRLDTRHRCSIWLITPLVQYTLQRQRDTAEYRQCMWSWWAWVSSTPLIIEVTNLMANRISDMDRKGEPYRIFYNTNVPARKAENRGSDNLFTAKAWSPQPSGLIGPVVLQPLQPLVD